MPSAEPITAFETEPFLVEEQQAPVVHVGLMGPGVDGAAGYLMCGRLFVWEAAVVTLPAITNIVKGRPARSSTPTCLTCMKLIMDLQ